MKVGDKLVCIEDYNDGGWLPKDYSLIKGQVYEVSQVVRGQIKIDRIKIEGKGNTHYKLELFVNQEQWRDNQINQILS